MDGPRLSQEEAQTLLKVPDARAGEGVPLQRLRVKAKEMGASEESQPHGEADQDMVSEQEDEEQEEQPKTTDVEQQQQLRQF